MPNNTDAAQLTRDQQPEKTMDTELNHLLLNASEEIKSLRRTNAILGAKCEVLDVFACAMGMKRDTGAAPDVVWAIDKYVRENS